MFGAAFRIAVAPQICRALSARSILGNNILLKHHASVCA